MAKSNNSCVHGKRGRHNIFTQSKYSKYSKYSPFYGVRGSPARVQSEYIDHMDDHHIVRLVWNDLCVRLCMDAGDGLTIFRSNRYGTISYCPSSVDYR